MKDSIDRLRKILRHQDYLYYKCNTPEISDGEYDYLFKQLKDLENENPEFFDPKSPTQVVGGGFV